jgi:hypothetical protein
MNVFAFPLSLVDAELSPAPVRAAATRDRALLRGQGDPQLFRRVAIRTSLYWMCRANHQK